MFYVIKRQVTIVIGEQFSDLLILFKTTKNKIYTKIKIVCSTSENV